MKIITISGLDGSGKSSQIQLLKEYFEAQELKVEYFHAVSFSLPNRFATFVSELKSLFPIPKKFHKTKSSSSKSVTEATAFSVFLRKLFLLIDLCRFKRYIKKLQKDSCDIFLSDRYFYDSVINIQFLSRKNAPLFAERFIAAPAIAIYLNAKPTNIMQRDRKPDQGIEYLKTKKELFDNAWKRWAMQEIDGNNSKEIVFDEIKRLVATNL